MPMDIEDLQRRAAEGSVVAQSLLGTPTDLPVARRWYEMAAEKGEFLAQVALARLLLADASTEAERAEATRWYSAAAAQADRIVDCAELLEAKAYVAAQRP